MLAKKVSENKFRKCTWFEEFVHYLDLKIVMIFCALLLLFAIL